MNLTRIALSFLAAFAVALVALTTASPIRVSAEVTSINTQETILLSQPAAKVNVTAKDDAGDLVIATNSGTVSVSSIDGSISIICAVEGLPGGASFIVHPETCDSDTEKDELSMSITWTNACPPGGPESVFVTATQDNKTLKAEATCLKPKGELKVLTDCLIPGPDGKVVFPPPPEGSFEMTLYRGKSTLHDFGIEEVIAVFTLACGQAKTFQLEPGTYNVFEFDPDPKSGFGEIANFCINVKVEPGAKQACNLTNDKFPPPPIVIKPPSTGDAGLVMPSSEDNTTMLLAATVAALLAGYAVLRFARR
jgi:hypothetical protein